MFLFICCCLCFFKLHQTVNPCIGSPLLAQASAIKHLSEGIAIFASSCVAFPDNRTVGVGCTTIDRHATSPTPTFTRTLSREIGSSQTGYITLKRPKINSLGLQTGCVRTCHFGSCCIAVIMRLSPWDQHSLSIFIQSHAIFPPNLFTFPDIFHADFHQDPYRQDHHPSSRTIDEHCGCEGQ